MRRSVVCITPNPALDVTYRTGRTLLHATNRVVAEGARPGGKGVNVARLLDAAGIDVTVQGPLGGDAGRRIAGLLEHLNPGVSQDWVAAQAETRSTVAVVDDTDTTMFNERGGPITAAEWDDVIRRAQQRTGPGTVVTVSGSLPPGVDPSKLGQLVATINECGACTIVDTSGPALIVAAEAGAHVLKPNHHELLEATGASSVQEGAALLAARSGHAVVVSRGQRGLLLATSEQRCNARLPEPLVGNPTGAGDAVVAAVAGELTTQSDALDEALRRALPAAIAWSAAAVLSPFAGEIDMSQIDRLSAEVIFEEE